MSVVRARILNKIQILSCLSVTTGLKRRGRHNTQFSLGPSVALLIKVPDSRRPLEPSISFAATTEDSATENNPSLE